MLTLDIVLGGMNISYRMLRPKELACLVFWVLFELYLRFPIKWAMWPYEVTFP